MLYTTASAQKFEGVYAGTLFSERNTLVMRTTGSAVAGVVSINKLEEFIFFGEINGSDISGTMNYEAKTWVFKGILTGDSLALSLTSGSDTRHAFLKRVSSNPNKNTSKLLDQPTQDKRLIGEWVLKKVENVDGSPKAIDEKMKGSSYVIYPDGSYYIRIPYLYNKMPSNFNPPKINWSTSGSILTTTSDKGKSGSLEYEIKSDTLILKPKTEKTYWVKSK